MSAARVPRAMRMVDCAPAARARFSAGTLTRAGRLGTVAGTWRCRNAHRVGQPRRWVSHARLALRPGPLSAVVPDRICAGGCVQRRPGLFCLAMAHANALCIVRNAAGCVLVVRVQTALWKCGRIHGARPLLLFTFSNSRQHLMGLAS